MVLNKKIDKFIDNINHSKIFAGLALLMLNVGSKHIDISLTPAQQALFKNSITKQILIFSIAWVGSRDVYTALVITCGYVLLTEILLNGNSNYNVLPEQLKKLETDMDTNNDGIIQEAELDKAINIIRKYKEKNKHNI
jgi:hypothetical protein